jgi:DNA-binding response OmpR family regulator
MARVLIVEDDADIGQVLQRSLQLEGYEVALAPDGVSALERAYDFEPDAVILDLGLPRLDGIDVAKRIRKDSEVPILMLTARDGIESRVAGLDAGADDYLVKPFERQELLARVRAMLRRTPPRGAEWLAVADLRLNPAQHQVFRSDREIDLTQREFELLEYLMRNERLVVSRDTLLEDVWGYISPGETNTVDVFVSNLRRKLESADEPRLLHTVRGAGYVLRAP